MGVVRLSEVQVGDTISFAGVPFHAPLRNIVIGRVAQVERRDGLVEITLRGGQTHLGLPGDEIHVSRG